MNIKKIKLYSIVIFIATLFMGIGYASINSISLNIDGELYAQVQDGIFISNVSYESNLSANLTSSTINGYYQTTLNSNVELSASDSSSNISYLVTFYNNTAENYQYIETIYEEDFYSNFDIIYELTTTSDTNIIKSKEYLTLKLTFKYKEDVIPTESINTLSSYLNFKFEKYINYVDYIEGTGTQYINTKVIPNNNTTFEINFSITDVETTNAILGVREEQEVGDIYNLFLHPQNKTSDRYQLRWDEKDKLTYISVPITEEKKITITRNTDKIAITSNGHTEEIESVTDEYQAHGELYIFNQNQLSTPETRIAKMKLYYFKIYQDNELIRDYAPALDHNDIPCLYDKVTKTYFYSETEDNFTYGDESSYREYIESSGTQYIDTKIKTDSTTTVEFVMSLNEVSSTTQSIFGARDAMDENKYNLFLYKEVLRWDYYESNAYPDYTSALTPPTFIETKSSSITIGNTTTEYDYTDTFSTNYNMYLYAINSTDAAIAINKGMKIYYFKVFKDGVIVRNLIPSVDENNKACFYDLVSKEYYYNANSDDSEFIAS